MPSQRNISQLAVLKDKLGRAESVVFADYAGLSVAQQTELRSKIADAGGEFTVAKNNLLKLALQERMANDEFRMRNDHSAFPARNGYVTGVAGGNIQHLAFLSGPTAVLFSYADEVVPLKVMVEFAKGAEKPTVKGGIFGHQELAADQILELAALPGKQELLGKLLGSLQSPVSGLVVVLQGNLRKLIYVLDAIQTKKTR